MSISVRSHPAREVIVRDPAPERTSVDAVPPSRVGPPGPQGEQGPVGPAGPTAWAPIETWHPDKPYSATPPAALVSFAGSSFVAVANSTGMQPDVSPGHWHLIASGAGGALSLSHEQSFQASDTWVIDHGLGYPPAVTLYDPDGGQIWGRIVENGPARTVIAFDFPVPGRATCS